MEKRFKKIKWAVFLEGLKQSRSLPQIIFNTLFFLKLNQH